MQSILAIDVTTALLAIMPLFFINVPQPQRQGMVDENGETPSVLQDTWAGLRYVLSWRGVMILLVGSALLNLLLTPSFTLIPLLVKDHFDGGPLQLGWLDSAAGIGIIVGGATLSVWGGFKGRVVTTLMGTVGVGVGALLIGLAPASAFLVAVGATFLIGLMLPLANGPMQAVTQAIVDPEMQGRVFTLTEALSTGMAPNGSLPNSCSAPPHALR